MNSRFKSRSKAARPVDAAVLEAMALRYVERYATTHEKLIRYLRRKIGERGWNGEGEPPLAALATRMTTLGYVNDRLFAESRTRSLARRGYGGRRIGQTLAADGIDGATRAEVVEDVDALATALAFARRKRIGPFDDRPPTPESRRRAIAMMVRAGHEPSLARRVAAAMTADQLGDGE